MTWNGYFEYAGNEIINVSRTEAYAKSAGLTWFRPLYNNDALPPMLGDGARYSTPLIDDAPWVDADFPESLDFYGVYPLDVTGLEDSTRTSTVVESLMDGGIGGRIRNTTRTVVFSVVLVAGSECAAAYGMAWLKRALLDGPCGATSGSNCNGADLCYLNCSPDADTDEVSEQGVVALLDGGYLLGDGPVQTIIVETDTIDGGSPGFVTVGQVDGGSVDGGVPSGVSADSVDGSDTGDSLDGGSAEGVTDEFDGGSPTGTGTAALTDGGGVEGEGEPDTHPGVTDVQVDVPDLDAGGPTASTITVFDGGIPSATGGVVSSAGFPFNYYPTGVSNIEECLVPYLRSLRKVIFNSGPTLVAKRETVDGGAVWSVSFTAVAGNPWELSAEVPVLTGFMDPTVLIPWANGVEPVGASIDSDGYLYTETVCAVPDFSAIYDPLSPALVPPPGPPTVPMGGYTPPANWQRRQFTIPAQYVPLWGEVVPKVQVHARGADLRNLRLRFYADPFDVGDVSDDPCAYCGDIVVSYLPQDYTLIIDGAEQTVYALSPGGARRRADSLVFKTDGTPFDWPSLSCGFGYIVTLDLPQTQVPPVVDLSLFARAV